MREVSPWFRATKTERTEPRILWQRLTGGFDEEGVSMMIMMMMMMMVDGSRRDGRRPTR
jgi:hypothetical protein